MRLDGGFLRIGLALDDDPGVFRPSRAFLLRVRVEDFWIERLQCLVRLELILNLAQKLASNGLVETEDANGDLRIVQNLLDDACEGNYGRFIMFTFVPRGLSDHLGFSPLLYIGCTAKDEPRPAA